MFSTHGFNESYYNDGQHTVEEEAQMLEDGIHPGFQILDIRAEIKNAIETSTDLVIERERTLFETADFKKVWEIQPGEVAATDVYSEKVGKMLRRGDTITHKHIIDFPYHGVEQVAIKKLA